MTVFPAAGPAVVVLLCWRIARTVIAPNPATAPIHIARVGGRTIRQTTGTPPSVNPIKRLYMIQRWCTTSSLIAPANSNTAISAAPTTVASTTTEERTNLRVETSATARTKRGYTPAASNIVPPLMPGTRLANPISTPPTAPRTANKGSRTVLSLPPVVIRLPSA
jgi:hypothetical protein